MTLSQRAEDFRRSRLPNVSPCLMVACSVLGSSSLPSPLFTGPLPILCILNFRTKGMKYQRYAKNQYKLLCPSSVPLSDTGTSHRRRNEIRPHQIPNEFGTMFFGIDTWLVAYGTFTQGPPVNKTLRINSYQYRNSPRILGCVEPRKPAPFQRH